MKNIFMNLSLICILLGLIFTFDYIDNKNVTELEHANYTEENTEPIREVVYKDLTFDELVTVLDKSLKSDLTGTGYLYAKYALKYGVDPYLAVAISLHETGCNRVCSDKVINCNNVGGQRFTPRCYSGAGATYGRYDTLEEGIEGFIRNIYNNYVRYGLLTAYDMQDKYVGTGTQTWAPTVEGYIRVLKQSEADLKGI